MIIAVGESHDPHIDMVSNILNENGVYLIRLDTSDDICISIELSTNIDTVSINANNINFNASDIDGIFWRAKPPLGFLGRDSLEKSIIEFKNDEWFSFSKGLMSYVVDKRWINSHMATFNSSVKIQQLRIACDICFKIPDSVIGTDKDRILELFNTSRYIIYKPLFANFFSSDRGLERIIYTNILDKNRFIDISNSIVLCPGIYQHYIEKKYEIRITVVYPDIFPVQILSQHDQQTRIDWRRFHYTNDYRFISIPNALSEKILLFMNRLGLKYGAFDFIVTNDDEYYFLECNPMGQWLWLERITGARISDAIAERFMDLSKKDK